MMPMFTMLHHFLDIVNQNRDKKLLKKKSKFQQTLEYTKKEKNVHL